MKRVYMDYAATTPVDPEVFAAMLPFLQDAFGNPSAVYEEGQRARMAVLTARQQVATALGAKPEEICFTGGGSEADNLALKGVLRREGCVGRHLVVSSIEHPAVLKTCEALYREGCEVTFLPVDADGLVSPSELASALREDTALVSVMTVNNEVGSIQDIERIGEIAHEHKVLFHTDAVQAFGQIPLDVRKLPVDLLSVSSHKIYGPKGVGALYIKEGLSLDPLIDGGGQEYHRRAGTENVAGIVGFGKAAEMCSSNIVEASARLAILRDQLIDEIESISGAMLMGHRVKRLSGNVHFCFEGIRSEALLTALDLRGIAASAGSACTAGVVTASHVLSAMGVSPDFIDGALRLSIGKNTTDSDIEYVVENLKDVLGRLRRRS